MHTNRNVPLQAVPHGHVTARRGCHRRAPPVWVPPSQDPSLLVCVCSARAVGVERTTMAHERVPVKLVNKGGPPALDRSKQQSIPSRSVLPTDNISRDRLHCNFPASVTYAVVSSHPPTSPEKNIPGSREVPQIHLCDLLKVFDHRRAHLREALYG